MAKRIRPIPVHLFPDIETNCFGFAIGNTEIVLETKKTYNLNPYIPLANSFLSKLKKLGYTQFPRKIEKLEEAKPCEYIFMLYGFKWERARIDSILGFTRGKKIPNYHIIRREPDGLWVHKPGWDTKPRLVTSDDWAYIHRNFGHNYVLFALDPEKEE